MTQPRLLGVVMDPIDTIKPKKDSTLDAGLERLAKAIRRAA